MRKRIFLFALAALCLAICFCVVSCGDEEENGGTTQTTNNTGGSFDPSKPHKHIFGAWLLVTAEGCVTDGEAIRRCPCGKAETKKLPATGHTFEDGKCTKCRTEVSWSEGIEYMLSGDGTYYIVSSVGTCVDEKIYIRKTYEGKPVKEIGDGAFMGCTTVSSVELCNGIEKIGELAFGGCTSLMKVYLPASVRSVGTGAFLGCNAVERVNLGAVTEIGDNAFRGCVSLKEISIPDTVLTVGTEVFEGCGDLKISCGTASKPSGWADSWAGDCENVEWKLG